MGRSENKEKRLFHSFGFDEKNYMLFFLGVLIIAIGYMLMATGETDSFRSVKLAPVILLLGYVVIIPLSIFYRFK